MRLTVQPTFPPTTAAGSCYLCKLSPRKDRAGDREQVVDTGVVIHMEGVVGICSTCVVEMGHLLDMVTGEQHRAIVDHLAAQVADAEALAAAAVSEHEAAEARANHAEQAYALAVRLAKPEAPKPAPKSRAPKALAEPAPA